MVTGAPRPAGGALVGARATGASSVLVSVKSISIAGALAAAFVCAASSAAAATAPAGAPRAKGKAPARAPVMLTPEERLSQRRAVRGSPVDEGIESPELGELRRFEEQAFPRANGGSAAAADADAVAEPGGPAAGAGALGESPLPGKWGGSGDVPDVFRAPETAPTAARVPPAPDSEWLRSLALPELPVRWDPQVLRYLDYFKNEPRGHAVMASWLRRGGRYRPLIEAVLEREGLPKDLFYVAMVESGFESAARSRVGAGGIWQFMPGAARAYGLEVSYWVDARRDPERSVEAAARYLKDLYVRFGSWHLVFASYNAGYGAVLRSITRYNTNDYWELCRHESGLPWESSLYVPKILAAAIVGHNPEAFGFADVVPDPPLVVDRVEVPGGTALATVARALRTKTEVLAALNPELLRERTPPDRGRIELRLPPGTAGLFAEGFERSRGPGDAVETVTLRFGETLDDVAKTRKVSVRELRRLNGVRDSSELRAGMAIVVPQRSATRPPDRPAGAAVSKDSGESDGADPGALDDDEILVAVPDRVFNFEGRDRVFYRTRDGDTLEEIAEAVGVAPEDLVEWNNLDPTAKLHPKMVLQIFVRKDFDPKQIVLLDAARVRVVTLGSEEFLQLEAARRGKKRLVIQVKPGETLVRLGRRYGLTVGDLARINRFSYNTELEPGQKVVVYSPAGDSARETAQGSSGPAGSDGKRDRGQAAKGGPGKTSDKPGDKSARSVPKSIGGKPAPAPARTMVANAHGEQGKDRGNGGDKAAAKGPAKPPAAKPAAPRKK